MTKSDAIDVTETKQSSESAGLNPELIVNRADIVAFLTGQSTKLFVDPLDISPDTDHFDMLVITKPLQARLAIAYNQLNALADHYIRHSKDLQQKLLNGEDIDFPIVRIDDYISYRMKRISNGGSEVTYHFERTDEFEKKGGFSLVKKSEGKYIIKNDVFDDTAKHAKPMSEAELIDLAYYFMAGYVLLNDFPASFLETHKHVDILTPERVLDYKKSAHRENNLVHRNIQRGKKTLSGLQQVAYKIVSKKSPTDLELHNRNISKLRVLLLAAITPLPFVSSSLTEPASFVLGERVYKFFGDRFKNEEQEQADSYQSARLDLPNTALIIEGRYTDVTTSETLSPKILKSAPSFSVGLAGMDDISQKDFSSPAKIKILETIAEGESVSVQLPKSANGSNVYVMRTDSSGRDISVKLDGRTLTFRNDAGSIVNPSELANFYIDFRPR